MQMVMVLQPGMGITSLAHPEGGGLSDDIVRVSLTLVSPVYSNVSVVHGMLILSIFFSLRSPPFGLSVLFVAFKEQSFHSFRRISPFNNSTISSTKSISSSTQLSNLSRILVSNRRACLVAKTELSSSPLGTSVLCRLSRQT